MNPPVIHHYKGYEIEETCRGCKILHGPKLCFQTNNVATAKLWIDWDILALQETRV